MTELASNVDENLQSMIFKMLDSEKSRAVVFSELIPFISL